MKPVYFCILTFLLSFSTIVHAQSPCDAVSVEVFGMDPQTGFYSYFGVRVSLSQPYYQDVTVSGYIWDGPEEHGYNENHPYTLTISAGSLSAETSVDFYQTGPAAEGAANITSVSPCPGSGTYDDFDSKFSYIGAFHNACMQNVGNNFQVPQNSMTYQAAIDSIKNFNKAYFIAHETSYFGTPEQSSETDQNFENDKNWADANQFENRLLTSNDPISLDSLVIKANSLPTVDSSNKQLFSQIADAIRGNINGTLSNADFEQTLVNIKNSWMQINAGNEQSDGAQLTGAVLAIGLKSCEFWGQNSDQIYGGESSFIPTAEQGRTITGPSPYQRPYLLPIIANDIAGAFGGAIVSAVGQQIVNGHINMRSVYFGALTGAVSTSVGVWGKVGKWLSDLF